MAGKFSCRTGLLFIQTSIESNAENIYQFPLAILHGFLTKGYASSMCDMSYTPAPTTWYNSSCIFSSKYFFSQMFLSHFFCG